MGEVGHQLAGDVAACCRAGGERAAAALRRAFDKACSVEAGAPAALDAEAVKSLDGPGLLLKLRRGGDVGLLLVPHSGQFLPDWVAAPDGAGRAKLESLAEELAEALLPGGAAQSGPAALWAERLTQAVSSHQMTSATAIPLDITCGDQTTRTYLLWPLAPAGARSSAAGTGGGTDDEPAAGSAPPSRRRRIQYRDLDEGIRLLPPYARSLLKIKVPVVVTLAATKLPVRRIVELSPGTIIQFDKSCEDVLSLEVGQQQVAVGEAVKVGEKFGLWITAITMPKERFWAIGRQQRRVRVK